MRTIYYNFCADNYALIEYIMKNINSTVYIKAIHPLKS